MQDGWGRWLLDQLGQTHVWDLLWDSALWALLGAGLGFLTSGVLCLGLVKLGAFDWGWKHAKWFRGLALALLVLLWTACCGALGLVQGALEGTEVVLRESQLATEAFPVVAGAGADLLAYLALAAPRSAQGQEQGAAEEAQLEAFRRGEWELDVVSLLEDAGHVSQALAQEQASKLEASALNEFPSWRGGRLQRLLRGGLDVLTRLLVDHAMDEELDRLGEPGRLARRLVEGLPAAASAEGNPRTLTREQLSAHLIQEGIVPGLLIPLRQLARSQQLTVALILLLGTLAPVAAFRLAESLRDRAAGEPAADDPQPDPATLPPSA